MWTSWHDPDFTQILQDWLPEYVKLLCLRIDKTERSISLRNLRVISLYILSTITY